MNLGSSVLHMVVEPATGCCRYVGVVDTIEQLLMIHIVECSFQIDRDCSNVGGDHRQCIACGVFLPEAMLCRVEGDVCQYFGQQELFQRFGFWAQ